MDRVNGVPLLLAGLFFLYVGTVSLFPGFRSRESQRRNALKYLPLWGKVFRKLYEKEPRFWQRIWAALVIPMATVVILTGLTAIILPNAVQ